MKKIFASVIIAILCLSTFSIFEPHAYAATFKHPPATQLPKSASGKGDPIYDEQLGITFTDDFATLQCSFPAVDQCDKMTDGYGPAYLLNGLSDAGYWYQVGLGYNWPDGGGGYFAGFYMLYEVFDTTGNSVFPSSGGAGVMSFSGAVNAGDSITLELYFSGGNVVMYAYDSSTGTIASQTYSDQGATYFAGLNSPANGNGYFTGLMTEWYHQNAYYGDGAPVAYSYDGFSISSAWVWMDEIGLSWSYYTYVTSLGTAYQWLYPPAPPVTNDANEYTNAYEFVTGADLYWLSEQQNLPDGSWSYSGYENVGITSLCTLAFLNKAVLYSNIQMALDWVVNMRQADFSISSPPTGGREDNRVYDTSMAILALVAGRSLGYTPSDGTNLDNVIDNAVTFLLNAQCVGTSIDGYTYAYDNLNYGGWGYPRNDWADLSNTQWAVLGLAAATTAGISTVPLSVWENAAVFTIRCLNDQNYNTVYYGANDGGFTYRPRSSSYESMTGAGVWSLSLCRSAGVSSVTVDSVNVPLGIAINDGVTWLQTYASVTQNYGDAMYFYYYTLLSVAKAYVLAGQGAVWYYNMVSQLFSVRAAQPASDGSYPEEWVEEPDTMATAEALLAIETRTPLPSNVSPALYLILGSYANIYITDPDGRHVGIDPNTGQVVNEIPNATFSQYLEQTALILDPLAGDYKISIFGTGTGSYNLTVEGEVNGTAVSSESFTGNTTRGAVGRYTSTITSVIGPLTVITTPPTVTILGDLNGDYKVSLADLVILANAYNSKPSDPNWNPNADIAAPWNVIGLTDLVTLAAHYGQHYP